MRIERSKLSHTLYAILFAVFLLLSGATGGETAADTKNILILHSYHQGLVWTDKITEGIYSIFDKYSPNLNIYVEYMDSKRHFDGVEGKYFASLREMYREKYRATRFDVIISSDDDAFQFLLRYRNELFPGVPVVFCGVNNFEDEMLHGHKGITGVVESPDQKASIDIALKLHPDARQIAIITDPSTPGRANRSILEKLAREYKNRVEFIFLDEDDTGLTMQELLYKLGQLPEKSIVYYSDFLRSQGRYIVQEVAVPRISQTAGRPIYAHYEEILGLGVVGGKLVNGYSHGRTAAEMARQILDGTPVSKLPIRKESVNKYMFDYRQLMRFGIDETKLPEGSIIINKPQSFYEVNRRQIWTVAGIIAGLTGLVFILAANIFRRKHAEDRLKAAFDTLEVRVGERTAELKKANILLKREVAERKRAEEAAHEREERYHRLFNSISDPVFVHYFSQNNVPGLFVEVNDAACRQYGYTRSELLQMTPMDIDAPEGLSAIPDVMQNLVTKGSAMWEGMHLSKEGRKIPVEISNVPFNLHGDQMILSVARDLTEQKRAEGALREVNNRLNAILQASPEAIYLINPQGIVTMWNKAAEQMFGWSEEEAVGKILPIVQEDKRQEFRDLLEKLLKGEAFSNVELRRQKKDGSPIDISISAAPIYDSKGKPNGIMAIAIDITLRKKMEEELFKKEKLESIGILAGGIAHDFNNLLTAIVGNIGLAAMFTDPGGKAHQRLMEAERASLRARDLTQQLLTFSRGGEPVKKLISVENLVRDSVGFVLRGSKSRAELDVPGGLWPVEADEGQINQVIHNLILNSDQAMSSGGIITVRCENVVIGPVDADILRNGRYVKITIKDEGIGIPREHMKKIFDPYFTTKQKGSGLGLTGSYAIIKKHDGNITVESELGVGTTFHVYLPASDKEHLSGDIPEDKVQRGNGRILIMDDEEMVSAIAGEILKELGYDVEFSAGGAEAIEKYKKAKESNEPFDIVIVDLTIPGGVGGEVTTKKLLEIDPHLKAIVSSGYCNHPVMSNFREYGFRAVITKPYKLEEISAAVHEVMHKD